MAFKVLATCVVAFFLLVLSEKIYQQAVYETGKESEITELIFGGIFWVIILASTISSLFIIWG